MTNPDMYVPVYGMYVDRNSTLAVYVYLMSVGNVFVPVPDKNRTWPVRSLPMPDHKAARQSMAWLGNGDPRPIPHRAIPFRTDPPGMARDGPIRDPV